ncbi:MAG: Crp/Fnr family transcriptional regulator [Acidimicrobiales bacterium]
MDDAALLSHSEFFADLDDRELAGVLAVAHGVQLSRNEVLFNEGDPAGALYGVRSGRVAISLRSLDGRESLLALMEPGDLFGDMPLFDGQPRSAQARALEASDLLYVPYPALRRVLENRPALLWNVVATLSRRLRSTDAALADSMFLDVPGRTAKRLLELAGNADSFALPITQEELAALVGASRERVNKAIAAFVHLGWLAQSDKQYRIADRAELARRAR